MDKLMTSKYPLCCVLMELAAQLEARGARMLLEWVPRGRNEPADALSNGDYRLFDPELRVEVDLEEVEFKVLPAMLATGKDLFERILNRVCVRPSTCCSEKSGGGLPGGSAGGGGVSGVPSPAAVGGHCAVVLCAPC